MMTPIATPPQPKVPPGMSTLTLSSCPWLCVGGQTQLREASDFLVSMEGVMRLDYMHTGSQP